MSIEVRPRFAKWQAREQAKALKKDAADKRYYAKIAAEENKIHEEIERRGPQPRGVSEWMGIAMVLGYILYLTSLLVGSKLFW